MARGRRPPAPRVKVPSGPATLPKQEKAKPPARTKRNYVSQASREGIVQLKVDHVPDQEEEIIKSVAFCCYTCACSPERIARVSQAEGMYIQAGDGLLNHRRCCHGAYRVDGNWAGPYEAASANFQNEFLEDACSLMVGASESPPQPPIPQLLFSHKEVHKKYDSLKRQEQELHNQDGLPEAASFCNTSPEYEKNRLWFQSCLQDRQERKPLVVLDMFAGVGTALVVLKKLEIAIQKIIHVEHDKVATHVYQWNHDVTYNPDLDDDGIEHVYYSNFEEIEQDLDSFLETHGRKLHT